MLNQKNIQRQSEYGLYNEREKNKQHESREISKKNKRIQRKAMRMNSQELGKARSYSQNSKNIYQQIKFIRNAVPLKRDETENAMTKNILNSNRNSFQLLNNPRNIHSNNIYDEKQNLNRAKLQLGIVQYDRNRNRRKVQNSNHYQCREKQIMTKNVRKLSEYTAKVEQLAQTLKQKQQAIESKDSEIQYLNKIIAQLRQQINQLRQKCLDGKQSLAGSGLKTSQPATLEGMNYLSIKIPTYTILLTSAQKQRIDNFVQENLNEKSGSAYINDLSLSMELQHLKTIKGLQQQIKYKDIQIVMLKKCREQKQQECLQKNKMLRVLKYELKEIKEQLKNQKLLSKIQNRLKSYEQYDQDLSLSISLD